MFIYLGLFRSCFSLPCRNLVNGKAVSLAPFPLRAVFFGSDPWPQSKVCRKRYRYRDTIVASRPRNRSATWDRTYAQLCKCHGNGVSSIITSRVANAGSAFQRRGGRRCESPLVPASAPGKAHRLCSFGCSSPAGLEQTQSHRASRPVLICWVPTVFKRSS